MLAGTRGRDTLGYDGETPDDLSLPINRQEGLYRTGRPKSRLVFTEPAVNHGWVGEALTREVIPATRHLKLGDLF